MVKLNIGLRTRNSLHGYAKHGERGLISSELQSPISIHLTGNYA